MKPSLERALKRPLHLAAIIGLLLTFIAEIYWGMPLIDVLTSDFGIWRIVLLALNVFILVKL